MTSRKPSLAETHPKLAAQAVGWDPTIVTKGSVKRVRRKCEIGHHWEATTNSCTSGSGCHESAIKDSSQMASVPSTGVLDCELMQLLEEEKE